MCPSLRIHFPISFIYMSFLLLLECLCDLVSHFMVSTYSLFSSILPRRLRPHLQLCTMTQSRLIPGFTSLHIWVTSPNTQPSLFSTFSHQPILFPNTPSIGQSLLYVSANLLSSNSTSLAKDRQWEASSIPKNSAQGGHSILFSFT